VSRKNDTTLVVDLSYCFTDETNVSMHGIWSSLNVCVDYSSAYVCWCMQKQSLAQELTPLQGAVLVLCDGANLLIETVVSAHHYDCTSTANQRQHSVRPTWVRATWVVVIATWVVAADPSLAEVHQRNRCGKVRRILAVAVGDMERRQPIPVLWLEKSWKRHVL